MKMTSATRSLYLIFIMAISFLTPRDICGQGGFVERVDQTFGSNQELVNGIQFSNQYIRSEGHPYWVDECFRTASVCIHDHWFEQVKIRFNLYSQRLELEYHTPKGHMNQIMTVPENITDFLLDGYAFRRVQIEENLPAYYQVISSGATTCYIYWSRFLKGSRSSGTSFSPIVREYWIQQGEQWMNFRDARTYLRAFPKEQKRDYKKLLRQQNFYFQRATTEEMVRMLEATMRLLEEGGEP